MRIESPCTLSPWALLCLFTLSAQVFGGVAPPCDDKPVPPWDPSDLGRVVRGTSQPVARDVFQICSTSAGLGGPADSIRYLSQMTRADFEMTARLDVIQGQAVGGIDAQGLGGVMARLDSRLDESPFVQISAHRLATGGVELISSSRLSDGGRAANGGAAPVPAALPVYLKVRRERSTYTTAYSRDGRTFTDHMVVKTEGTPLTSLIMTAGMIQSSESPQAASQAIFGSPGIRSSETGVPPRLFSVDPPNSPVEGGIEVLITGARLAEATGVSLAGVPAQIVKKTDDVLVVLAGPAGKPVSGDVLVMTPGGAESLEEAFFYIGRSYVRGDMDGDLEINISDAIAELGYLFLGTRAPVCMEGADVNLDGKIDIGDPVYSLGYQFLGSPGRLPDPWPEPGVSRAPALACGLPLHPRVVGISQESIKEGDVVTLLVEDYDPEQSPLVFFGSSEAEVLKTTAREITARVGPIVEAAMVSPEILIYYPGIRELLMAKCKAKSCRLISVGVIAAYKGILVRAIPSTDITMLGVGRPEKGSSSLVVQLEPGQLSEYDVVEVSARLNLPVVQGRSKGSLYLNVELPLGDSNSDGVADISDSVAELILVLESLFLGSAPVATVEFNPRLLQIIIQVSSEVRPFLEASFQDSLVLVSRRPPKGRCGPSNLHPITDRRAFGWCRFEELIEDCAGLPKWEYFVPRDKVFQASGAIFPLPNPNTLSPFGEKDVLYNQPAYCHVRTKGLYKQCVLDDLAGNGATQIPHFPRSAIVIKTRWQTEADLLSQGKDPTKHYSYVYSGTRYCLVLFHYTTKDVDDWYWADFYVPPSSGGGGCGGSGTDRPASITGVWANYEMCTNLLDTEPGDQCGNLRIPVECVQTCVSCHKGASVFTPNGSLKADFLFSFQAGIQGNCP